MTSTNEAAMFADAEQRSYLIAAAEHRSRLQQSDTENLFDIAARLRKTVEAARAADARKPAGDATLSDTDRFAAEEDEEEDKMKNGSLEVERSESDSDCNPAEKARADYLDFIHNAYKMGR